MLKITTDCFLITKEATEGVKSAFQDHRLAKVVPTVVSGSFEQAVERYKQTPSPPLIILEHKGKETVLAQLETLADVCNPNTRLILLGEVNDIDFYRQLKRRGIDDYLPVPFTPDQLTTIILDIYSAPNQGQKGQVISVIGANGGSGNSIISQNLAFNLTRLRQEEAIVVDLDLAFGSCDLGFNIETPVGIRNALAEPERIDEVFLQRFAAKYNDQLQLLGLAANLESVGRIDSDRLETVLDGLRQHVKYIVVDLPHLWDTWVQNVLRLSDAVVLTVPLDLEGLRNGRHLLEWISRERPRDPMPHVVLNNMHAMIDAPDFTQRLGAKNPIVLPYDPEAFRQAMSEGKMLEEVQPKSKSALALMKLAENIGLREKTPRSSTVEHISTFESLLSSVKSFFHKK